jgi:hypothetical protein
MLEEHFGLLAKEAICRNSKGGEVPTLLKA